MSASKSELWDQLAKALKILDETHKYGELATTNLKSLINSLQEAYEGSHIAATQGALGSFRSNFSSLIGSTALLNALIIELARNGYNSLASTAQAALDDIAKGMHDLAETVKNRAFTFGSVVIGGSNVGTGTVYRLLKDKNGYDIESGQPVVGALKVKIISDHAVGRTLGNEEASLFGVGQVKVDEIELGTAPSGTQSLIAKRAIDGLLQNASFETTSGAGATFAISSWILSAAINFSAITADYFRKAPGLTLGTSIRFADNGNLQQNMGAISIDVNKPLFLLVRLKRETNCDGTVTIQLGTQTTSVALVAQSGWFDLVLGNESQTKGWYDNFKEDNGGLGARVKITLAARTVGTLLVDEIILIQPTQYSGLWYLLTAGATDFLKDDYFEITDSSPNTGKIQYWLARLFSRHLPHTAGAPTYPDA